MSEGVSFSVRLLDDKSSGGLQCTGEDAREEAPGESGPGVASAHMAVPPLSAVTAVGS